MLAVEKMGTSLIFSATARPPPRHHLLVRSSMTLHRCYRDNGFRPSSLT